MKILIAEDDRDTRQGLIDIFKAEGYEILEASNGKEALILFRDFHPDLVCLDIMMPNMSGYDACREIRKIDENVPVLFLSAKSEEIDKVVGLELGADDYVVKPFGVREIQARVKALLRRSQASPEEELLPLKKPFHMGHIKVVPEEYRFYRNDKPFDLSEREVIILGLLAAKKGKVVTREELFNVAWGFEHVTNSRTIDQTVSQLRKKVEENPSDPVLIKTVHGAGYRWEG